jgi:hypothetical protein
VLTRHPLTPLERVNKVILEKWNSSNKAKKDLYKRKVDRESSKRSALKCRKKVTRRNRV